MQTDTAQGHLLLIDGFNIVRRVYGANPAPDSSEKAKAVLKNSLSSFRRALETHKPTHVLAPFDFGGPTWRHELYADYKKKRKPMPQELSDEMPAFYERLRDELGVPTVLVPGVEADDVLSTAVARWDTAKRGPVTVLSTDKDIAVLGLQGARVWNHFDLLWHDEEWCQKKFGVTLALLPDLLALTGDSSDDIPGVPSVAEKTAAKLLNTYGSLDGVIAAAPTVKGKLGENLRASIELVRMARQLVSFKTDISLGLTWNSLRYTPPEA